MKRNFRKPLVIAGPKGCKTFIKFSVKTPKMFIKNLGYGSRNQILENFKIQKR